VHYGNLILDLSPLYFTELQENGSGIEDDRHTEEEFLSYVMDSGMYCMFVRLNVMHTASTIHSTTGSKAHE
jgi:hypothetical protein